MKLLEKYFKKFLFNLLIMLSRRGTTNSGIYQPTGNDKILFIRLNRIGDALVTTHLYSIIKKEFSPEIHVLADRKNSFVFTNNPNIDKVHVLKKSVGEIITLLKTLKRENFTVVTDLHDDVSTTASYVVALLKAKHKFALKKNNYQLFTNTVTRIDSAKHHVMERNAELLSLFGINKNNHKFNVEYYPVKESYNDPDEFFNQFDKNKFLIGINISAGSDARFWGEANFINLIEHLNNTPHYEMVLLTSPGDLVRAEKISEGKTKVFCSKSFDSFAVAISKLDLLFTPDTSTVHLASCFNVPVFGLYVKYQTKDIIWYPYASDYEAVITEEPNFDNLEFMPTVEKFNKFLEKHSYDKKDSTM